MDEAMQIPKDSQKIKLSILLTYSEARDIIYTIYSPKTIKICRSQAILPGLSISKRGSHNSLFGSLCDKNINSVYLENCFFNKPIIHFLL